MKRTLFAIAALGGLAAAPTLAQNMDDSADLIRSRDMTGSAVYTTNEAYDEGSWGMQGEEYSWGWSGYDSVGADWNQVGQIEDVVLDNSGQMVGVVAEVGGFLDLGDKHVMLQVEDVDLVATDSGYSLITRYNEEDLENLEGVDEGFWE